MSSTSANSGLDAGLAPANILKLTQNSPNPIYTLNIHHGTIPTTTQFSLNCFHRLGRASEQLEDPGVLFLLFVCVYFGVFVHLWIVCVCQIWTHSTFSIWWEPRCTNTQIETEPKTTISWLSLSVCLSVCLGNVETQTELTELFTHNKKSNQLYGNISSWQQCCSDMRESRITANESLGLALDTIAVSFTASSSGFDL